MAENFNVFDFCLSADDRNKIACLDTETSLLFSHYAPETVEMLINMVNKQ